jgi:hypothetical protein
MAATPRQSDQVDAFRFTDPVFRQAPNGLIDVEQGAPTSGPAWHTFASTGVDVCSGKQFTIAKTHRRASL